MAEWREPTAVERALLGVILLSDIPERNLLRKRLLSSRVRPSCICGCGSVEFESAAPEALPGDWEFELDALTRSGARVAVALRRRGPGERVFLEITRLGSSEPVVEVAFTKMMSPA